MHKLELGPLMEPLVFTLEACRSRLSVHWQLNPEDRGRNVLYPVHVPEGSFPELFPGFTPASDFGPTAFAQRYIDLAPPGWRVVGLAERFLLIEPNNRVEIGERILHIRLDDEIEYRELQNFVGANRYGTRKPGPNEIGVLVKSVTTNYGIKQTRGSTYGDEIICRVVVVTESTP